MHMEILLSFVFLREPLKASEEMTIWISSTESYVAFFRHVFSISNDTTTVIYILSAEIFVFTNGSVKNKLALS